MTTKNGIDHRTSICTKTKIGKNPLIRAFSAIEESFIGDDCQIREGVFIANSVVGDKCLINSGTCIENANIGKGVRIRQNCTLIGIRIEDNALIGAGSTILPGITIGKGAVIGIGSIVKCNVRDHHVYKPNSSLAEYDIETI